MTDTVVVDASAMVDLLLDAEGAAAVGASLRGLRLATPAHFDVEVLSALGRLHRAGELSDQAVSQRIERLASAPIERVPVTSMLTGAWERRSDTRLADALYLELADTLDTKVVTTDRRLARANPALTEVPGG